MTALLSGGISLIFGADFSVPGFMTDWSLSSVDPSEFQSGGPGKDGIPSLTEPEYVTAASADEWLADDEAVILLRNGKETKIFPLQILIWHEIVNDRVGDDQIVVTWCPLCNSAVVFDVSERFLEFGTTGWLRFSNMLMYDRQTESWWQQAEGLAVMGEMTGTKLDLYPSLMLPWKDVKDLAGAKVVSRDTGYNRPYGRNPYAGYDGPGDSPFLLDRIRRNLVDTSKNGLLDRVLLVPLKEGDILLSYRELRENPVVNKQGLVIFWEEGTASPLDANRIAGGRDVGSANAFSSSIDGRDLSFELRGGTLYDMETGTHWTSLGYAEEGPLSGRQLDAVPSIQHFWFSGSLLSY